MSEVRLRPKVERAGATEPASPPEDIMSAFIDPATALTLARGSREDQLRRATEARLARTGRPVRVRRTFRRRPRVLRHLLVIAH
jgi:hypothetical protein